MARLAFQAVRFRLKRMLGMIRDGKVIRWYIGTEERGEIFVSYNMATFSSIFGIKSSHTSKHHPHVLQSASSSTSSMTPLTAPASASDDKNFAILKELASLSCNRNCFDCLQRGPTYVNMTIGSFICTSCSGKLLELRSCFKNIL